MTTSYEERAGDVEKTPPPATAPAPSTAPASSTAPAPETPAAPAASRRSRTFLLTLGLTVALVVGCLL
ncbi:iron ABC transporter permease, partial [Streptomyces californicus]